MKSILDPLYIKIAKEKKYLPQLEEILKVNCCQIEPDFLGFTDTYRYLAKLIPHDWTIIDLGCANAIQSYYFMKHRRYIGVDSSDCLKFQTPNSIYFQENIKDFIINHKYLVKAPKTFAIVNYVPIQMHRKDMNLVKDTFDNLHIYYPE